MRKTLLTAAACLTLMSPAAAQDTRLVTMTGHGIVQGKPDRAWVTVGIEVRDPDAKLAQQRAAVVMDHIQQRVKALGIEESALRTAMFNVMQDWEFNQGRRTLRGYVVSNRVDVRVDDIEKVPAVIDGAIAAGATNVQGVRWDMKNRDALEREAVKLAFEDARRRAEVIARASGGTLGAVVAAQEARAGTIRPVMPMASTPAPGAIAESVTVVNPGEMDIRATVTVTFLLQT